MTLADFGRFTFHISLAFFIAGLSLSGGVAFTVREIAKSDSLSEAFQILKFTLCIGLLASFVLSTIFIAFETPSNHQIFKYQIVILLTLQIIHALVSASLRGLGLINIGQCGDLLLRPMIFNALIIIYFAFISPIDILLALKLQIYATLAALAFTLYFNLRQFYGKVRKSSPNFERKWFSSIIQLAGMGWLAVANTHLLLIFTGILSDPKDVGLLRVAIQCALLVSLSLNAIEMAQAPKYALAAKQDDRHLLHKLLQQSCMLAGMISLASGLFIIIFIELVLKYVFGPEFTAAATATQVLVFAYIFNSMTGNVGILLIAINEERKAMVASILAVGTMTISAYLLIPSYGVLGASISAALGLTVRNIYNLILCWKLTSIIALPFVSYIQQD